ncbi:hypothetical protein NKR23_g2885 [Pleurostoma richardsiae]|uniref:Uncharacterized protein n=1 Tax=Pleurostoma richardsiae TaxID=41990 RepID=A0AA38S9A4_9PEZI|nr:hypothetical protein NKR23_g2885 [Pleurostoma richardsiae]
MKSITFMTRSAALLLTLFVWTTAAAPLENQRYNAMPFKVTNFEAKSDLYKDDHMIMFPEWPFWYSGFRFDIQVDENLPAAHCEATAPAANDYKLGKVMFCSMGQALCSDPSISFHVFVEKADIVLGVAWEAPDLGVVRGEYLVSHDYIDDPFASKTLRGEIYTGKKEFSIERLVWS